MVNDQSEYTYRKGDISFLLDIIQAILPLTALDWHEVADVYNSGVSYEHSRSSAELRTRFRLVCPSCCDVHQVPTCLPIS
jgi:hypothetical protein